MTNTPEQEAKELLEMFRLYAYDADGHHNTESLYSQRIAIKHVERVIWILGNEATGGHYTQEARNHYQQVLQILKDKK